MRDQYDLEHEETGSGNISRANPEWMMVLRQAREDADGRDLLTDEFVLHIAYALVRKRQNTGEQWGKCMDCGCPFRMEDAQERGGSREFCSSECGVRYTEQFSKSL